MPKFPSKTLLTALPLALSLLAVPALVWAQSDEADDDMEATTATWDNTREMHLAFHNEGSGLTVFHGKMTLTGTLGLSWYYDDKDWQLSASFTPDKGSHARLPHVSNNYYPDTDAPIILLNSIPLDAPSRYDSDWKLISKHAPLPNIKKLIGKKFPLPPKPTSNREEDDSPVYNYPAKITITAYGSSVECDGRDYYATAIAITPLTQKGSKGEQLGC